MVQNPLQCVCFTASNPQTEPRVAVEDYEQEEDQYGNTGNTWVRSEAIPVDKLEWYNKTNVAAILEQYEVSL